MNKTTTALAVAIGAVLCLGSAICQADTITLKQAVDRASQRPSVQLVSLDVDAARATARGAALPAHNPNLRLDGGPQLGTSATAIDFEASIDQTIELGGKRDARIRVAGAAATVSDRVRSGDVLAARVEAWRAFERAIVVRDRLATRREVEQLTDALVTAMQRTAAAGGTTQLRVNVLSADAGRARRERIAAEADYATALALLAAAIGATPTERLEPDAVATELPAVPGDEAAIVARALSGHPQILIAAAELEGARARIDAADAQGVSDVTLGVGYAYGRDPGAPNAIIGTISIPLPIRNRNQGERAAARIEARHAEIESARTAAEIERRARLAYENYQRARDAVTGFGRDVTDKLHDNLTLAQDSFTKGGIDFVELTLTRRNLIDARLAFLDAEIAAVDAWADLALATAEVQP